MQRTVGEYCRAPMTARSALMQVGMRATLVGFEPRQASLTLIRGRRGCFCTHRAALGSHNEHDIDSVETDNLPRANQTKPVININVSDEPPLSVAASSGQTLALTTVSASSLPDLGEGRSGRSTS